MMRVRTFYCRLMFILAGVCFAACDNSGESDPLILQYSLNGNKFYSNDHVALQIYAFTTRNNSLENIRITTFDKVRGQMTLMEFSVAGTEYAETYDLQMPLLVRDSVEVEMVVTATDNTGFSQQVRRTFLLLQRDRILEELAGNVIYRNGTSSTPDGYSFTYKSPIYTGSVDMGDSDESNDDDGDDGNGSGSRLIDIYVDGDEWKTKNKICFVRTTSFDYPKATQLSVMNAYANKGVISYSIENIQKGDIILVGNDLEAIGVILIQEVYDNRYVFCIKYVE